MAFTFNWAGVNVPTIQGGTNNYQQTIRNDAANWGSALRGYENRKANQEYADILDARSRVAQIQARIAQLQERNREIMQELSAITPTAVEPVQPYQPGPAFVSTPEQPTPTNYPYYNELG